MYVSRAGESVPVPKGKQRVLLATLLLEANTTVSYNRIIERIWGAHPPVSARATVHSIAMRLRRTLGDGAALLTTQSNGYVLGVERDRVDVALFRDLLARSRQIAPDDAATELDLLTEALALWRGPALHDVASESLQRSVVPRLTEERLQAIERRAELGLDLGQYELLGELGELTQEHPTRERLWALRILGLARAGRQAESLAAYRTMHALFRAELGIEPGEHVRRLHQEVLAGRHGPDEARPKEPLVAARPVVTPAQLPPDVPAFVGREEAVARLCGAHPVSVVSGPPGVGKTALALHAAHRLRPSYPDGQLYVDLRGYARAEPLPPHVVLARFLQALGVPANQIPIEEAGQTGLFRSLLAGRRMLLVLDNAADAGQVRPLLPGQPGCLVLVTSRDQLRGLVAFDGAHPVPLEVMTDDEARAVLAAILGRDRVAADPDAIADVADQCTRLPLALRIAAANLLAQPHQPIGAYADALRERGRLVQLRVDGYGAVRAAFDLSYARLVPAAARLFRLLSLVAGPEFSAPAAAALLDEEPVYAERALDALVDASLVVPTGTGRYRFHDLLREYSASKLDTDADADTARTRLHDFYLHTAHAATHLLYPDLTRPLPGAPAFATEAAALEWLDAERPNLVAAALAAGDAYSWRLAEALRGYFWGRGHAVEGLTVCAAVLAAARAAKDRAAEAAVLDLAGLLHYVSSRYDQAERHHREALAIRRDIGDLRGQADSLHNLGRVYSHAGRPEDCATHHREALELARQIGDREAQALNVNYLGVAHLLAGRPVEATKWHLEALTLSREIGSQAHVCRVLNGLGLAAWHRGELGEAIGHHEECVVLARRIGNRHMESSSLICLAEARSEAGQYERAITDARRGVEMGRVIGELRHEVSGAEIVTTSRLRAGDTAGVLDDYAAALAQARDIGFVYGEVSIMLATSAALRTFSRPDEAVSYAEQGLDRTIAAGLLLLIPAAAVELAHGQLDRGRPDLALPGLRDALKLARERGQRLVEARAMRIVELVNSTNPYSTSV